MNDFTHENDLKDQIEIARAATRISKLPAIATQDWCDQAAAEMLGVRRAAVSTVTIASVPSEGGRVFSVEATGGASGQQAIQPETLGRIHSDTARDLGWNIEPAPRDPANPHNGRPHPTIRVARLHDLPSWSSWPVTTPGKRWARLGISELLVLQAPLFDERPDRVIAVELGATRDQPAFGRKEALAATALLTVLRERARLAFGNRETSAMTRVTRREQEILEQLTLGKTVRDIAASLNRSPHTVHDHVKSLHRKLNASSRGELISRFLGYITAEGERVDQPTQTPADVYVGRVGVGTARATPKPSFSASHTG
jgi:DNA-binding CsgD family transcriptional regulator